MEVKKSSRDKYRFTCVDGSVLYLQIEMRDPLGVEIVDSVEDLLDKLSGLLLAERLLLSQEIEQLSSRYPAHTQTHTHSQRLILHTDNLEQWLS